VVEKSKRVDSDVYVSKIDGSYLTHVGLEDDLKHFLKRGITEQIQSSFKGKETANIGFNPKDKKWFGWSHRAIYGFGIGSKCKKGDCGYKASNKEDFKEACLSFWGDSEYSISDDPTDIHKEPVKTLILNEDGTPKMDMSNPRYKSLDTTAIICSLVKAIQQLNTKVDKLTKLVI